MKLSSGYLIQLNLKIRVKANYLVFLVGATEEGLGAGAGVFTGAAIGCTGLAIDEPEVGLGCGAEVGDLANGSTPNPAAVAEIEKDREAKAK